MRERVLLGFSGGIDSTAAALWLSERDYEVILCTLDTSDDRTLIDVASKIAERLQMKHIVCDVRKEFDDNVVNYFISSYLRGETPAPCTVCNVAIKWLFLSAEADRLGCERISTGHYFGVVKQNGHYFVRRAADSVKDQSYYLWGVPERFLRRAILPMSDCLKSDARVSVADFVNPKESMGVCFLQGVDYREFLRSRGCTIVPGDIVNRRGEVVGQHNGCALYTIGQKRGIETSYIGAVVVGIDIAKNNVIIGDNSELFHRHLTVRNVIAPDMKRLLTSKRINLLIRGYGLNPKGFAVLERDGSNLLVTLSEPAWAAAPGQPVVFYEDDIVVGGGYLVSSYI